MFFNDNKEETSELYLNEKFSIHRPSFIYKEISKELALDEKKSLKSFQKISLSDKIIADLQ